MVGGAARWKALAWFISGLLVSDSEDENPKQGK